MRIVLTTMCIMKSISLQLIIKDDCVATVLEQVVAEEMEQKGLEAGDKKAYIALLAKYTARANKLLSDMKAALSSTLIRYGIPLVYYPCLITIP